MPQIRQTGASTKMKLRFASAYGETPTLGGNHYRLMPFYSAGLSEEQPLEDEAELGLGVEAQAPSDGEVTDEGDIVVAVDDAYFGHWLYMLLGTVSTAPSNEAAVGTITFADEPSAGERITLDGIIVEFSASVSDATAAGTDGDPVIVQIQGALATTLDEMISVLNDAGAPAEIQAATYTEDGVDTLTITHDTAGTAGNAYTLAVGASIGATASAATLTGGGYKHVWTSGNTDLPDAAIEIGSSAMQEAVFALHTGVLMERIAFSRSRTGTVQATLGLVGQKETINGATVDAAATQLSPRHKFQQAEGSLVIDDGVDVGTVIGFSLSYTNNLDRVPGLDRSDGRISGADVGQQLVTGEVAVRFANRTLIDLATSKAYVDIKASFAHPSGSSLEFHLPQVRLPKPKREVSGPGGIEATFAFRGFQSDDGATRMLIVTLKGATVADFSDLDA